MTGAACSRFFLLVAASALFCLPGFAANPNSRSVEFNRDIRPILELINGYAAKGIMLPRTEFELSEAIRDFTVVTLDDHLLGCGALHFYSPTVAEIRSIGLSK